MCKSTFQVCWCSRLSQGFDMQKPQQSCRISAAVCSLISCAQSIMRK